MENILVDPSNERRILDFRPLGFRDVAVLGRYSYAAAHGVLEDHSHGDMLEICFLESGEQTYVVGGRAYPLTGGDLFVTFPNEHHGTGHALQGKGVLYWMLLFVPKRNRAFLSLKPDEAQELVDQLLRLPRRFPAVPDIKKTLDRVFDVFDRGEGPLHAASLRNVLLRFLFDVLDSAGRNKPGISPEMQQVVRFIAENLDRPLTVRELARQVYLSQSRLKTRFKAELGIPPADYIARQKIARASELLRSTDCGVADIARALGFSTSQYFATVFRRYTGQSPSRFRHCIREDSHLPPLPRY